MAEVCWTCFRFVAALLLFGGVFSGESSAGNCGAVFLGLRHCEVGVKESSVEAGGAGDWPDLFPSAPMLWGSHVTLDEEVPSEAWLRMESTALEFPSSATAADLADVKHWQKVDDLRPIPAAVELEPRTYSSHGQRIVSDASNEAVIRQMTTSLAHRINELFRPFGVLVDEV
jgi:hypothetical protein